MDHRPVVLVTGAGKGLGHAICRAFRNENYEVIATDIDSSLLADFENLDGFTTATLDVSNAESTQTIAALIEQQFGRLDLVINNAGIIAYMPVCETDPETLIQHFQINSFGSLRVVHACLDLLASSQGRVINISSESWRLRTPFQIYQTTKLALEGISDVQRRELIELGIQVATIRPGAIDTELFHAMGHIKNPLPDGKLAQAFQRFANMLTKNAPKRRSSPEQVAALVVRAATDKKMRPHYQINNMFSLKLLAALPTRWTDRLIRLMIRRL